MLGLVRSIVSVLGRRFRSRAVPTGFSGTGTLTDGHANSSKIESVSSCQERPVSSRLLVCHNAARIRNEEGKGNEQKQRNMSFLANRSAPRSGNADDCDGSSGRARAKHRWHDRVDTGRTLDAAQVYERGVALEQDPRSRAQLLMHAVKQDE